MESVLQMSAVMSNNLARTVSMRKEIDIMSTYIAPAIWPDPLVSVSGFPTNEFRRVGEHCRDGEHAVPGVRDDIMRLHQHTEQIP